MRSNNLLLFTLLLYTDLAPALPLDLASKSLLSYPERAAFSKREPAPPLDSEDAERMYVSHLFHSCHHFVGPPYYTLTQQA